jgi:spore germination protein GerM
MRLLRSFSAITLLVSCSAFAQVKTVFIYFNNPKLELREQGRKNSSARPFNVYPAKRTVLSTDLYQRTLQELLHGPTPSEIDSGYFTTLQDLRLTWFSLHNGTATVELVGQLRLAGTLSGPRLKLQVEKTLKQFSNIRKVVISVNGRRDFDSLK